MKKIFALLTVFLLITACSDDDEVNDNGEQIVGSWILVDWDIPLPGYQDGPTECNLESNITFNADNTASTEFYEEDGECTAETESGDWEYHGDGEYTFEVPSVGQQRGTVNFESDNRFTFILSIGSMTFERE